MKNLRITTTILVMAFVGLTAMSCKDGKKEESNDKTHSEMSEKEGHHHDDADSDMNSDEMNTSNDMDADQQGAADISMVINNYMALKDALVASDNATAQNEGKKTMNALNNFDMSSYNATAQKELKDIVEDAVENAEHISESPIEHQREHFKQLSIDVTDMVAITGTKTTLYQQFCPMYDKGSAWLSMSKDIKNPYYGDKMLTCGKVQKEIN